MNWLYIARDKWFSDGTSPCQSVYLRPFYVDDSGEEYAGKIIDMEVVALEWLINKNAIKRENADYLFKIYENDMPQRDYKILFDEIEENAVYMNSGHLYIRDVFDKNQLIKWLKIYLAVLGHPCDELQESDMWHFPETNAILSMFTEENLKKMEYRLGKEWWKGDKKKENKKMEHQSDKELIEKLLAEIKDSKTNN